LSETNWEEYQKTHKFKETNYSVKEREWKMLDYANPAWTKAMAFGGREYQN
jgi:hypothetical protein